MELSQRVANLPPYLFVEISRKIAERKARGEEVVSFAIGDPDLATPQHIIDTICAASKEPENHRYPETEGLPELRRAIARWYDRRFGVALDADTEILPLIGSKEGIAHMAFCMIDAGDIALVPNPSYPVYPICTTLAGGTTYEMPLTEQNDFLPDFDAVPEDICTKAKLLWLNYPNNPTAATADLAFYERAVAFAAKHDIAVCHDGPYSEVAYDGYKPVSFLQAGGASEVGVEFHSLSKSYNMTGWRIGMAVGNATLIDALKRIKSNIDSGIPQAIQQAAITALDGPQDCITKHNEIYQRRRDLIVDTLNRIGLKARTPKASLYIWAAVPPGYTSQQLASELLEDVGVVVTPGTGYGTAGEGFIRLSLTISDVSLMKGLTRLSEWKGGKLSRNKKRR
jgi:LL-diaminopimelate aminotransferase